MAIFVLNPEHVNSNDLIKVRAFCKTINITVLSASMDKTFSDQAHITVECATMRDANKVRNYIWNDINNGAYCSVTKSKEVKTAEPNCTREKYPKLFAYLEAYGLDKRIIDAITLIKGRASTGYYVLGYATKDDMIELLDLSNTPDEFATQDIRELGWSMLNDGMSPSITIDDWNKMQIDNYCEVFTIPGHAEYG